MVIKTQKTYFMNYVGNSYYTQSSFENEALKIGVNRSVNFNTLKKLKFGDQILLASYIPSKPEGTAEVFGYFTLNGISHNLPPDLCEKLLKKLTTINTIDAEDTLRIRACGSYQIKSTTVIKESLDQIVAKIKETLTNYIHHENWETLGECFCPKCKTQHLIENCIDEKCKCCVTKESLMNKYKWFLSGNYTPLSHFLIKPIKFARGLKSVEITNLQLTKQKNTPHNLVWIYNYKLRKYMPSYSKNSFGKNENFSKYFKK